MPWNTATTRSSGFTVTAAIWNAEHVENMNFLREVAYAQFISPVSITATTDATSQQVVTTGAITYENVPHEIEFFAPGVSPDTGAATRDVRIGLFDGTTSLGRIANVETPAASSMQQAVQVAIRYTPSAGTHTFNIKAVRRRGHRQHPGGRRRGGHAHAGVHLDQEGPDVTELVFGTLDGDQRGKVVQASCFKCGKVLFSRPWRPSDNPRLLALVPELGYEHHRALVREVGPRTCPDCEP